MEGPGKNSLGTAMMTFLLEGLRAANGEPILLTGAGDAFAAGLLLALSDGADPVAAVGRGHEVAAQQVRAASSPYW